MAKLDPFTSRRIKKFVQDHRARSGELPALKDFSDAGISEDLVDLALKERLLEKFYVTLTNGTIVKGYKIAQGD